MKSPFHLIFLSGGTGSRFGSSVPKQYLPLQGRPLALHSFAVFAAMPELQECVVVCHPEYEALFTSFHPNIIFARPGVRRQDSVRNGLQQLNAEGLVCIHDAARPYIDEDLVRRVVQGAQKEGAAAAGVKARSTMKLCDDQQRVVDTPNRDYLWEMQTPQVVRRSLLEEGLAYADQKGITVTDDLSLVELLGLPARVVEGSYRNSKITVPEDLPCAIS